MSVPTRNANAPNGAIATSSGKTQHRSLAPPNAASGTRASAQRPFSFFFRPRLQEVGRSNCTKKSPDASGVNAVAAMSLPSPQDELLSRAREETMPYSPHMCENCILEKSTPTKEGTV